jgi:ABC-type transporter Mla subunit MlaD
MANTVNIKIRVDDSDAKKGFDGVRGAAHHLGDDLETESDKIGNRMAEGIGSGAEKKLRNSKGQFKAAGASLGDSIGEGAEEKIKNDRSRFSRVGQFLSQDLGKGLASALPKSLTEGVTELGPKIGPLGLVIGAGIAPVLGATISASIIAAAGVGAVGIGVALAAQNPKVKEAAGNLGTTIKQELVADSAGFIDPVLKQITKLGAAFESERGKIQRIFATSSGFLDPLTDGVIKGVDGILSGFDSLVSKGRPVMDALGRTFATVGDSVGDMLTTISGGSEDAAGALEDVGQAASLAVEATGGLVRTLTELYGAMSYVSPLGEKILDWLSKDSDKKKDAAAATDNLTNKTDAFGQSVTTTGSALLTLDQQMNQVYDSQRSLFDSTTDTAKAFDDFKSSIKKNGNTLDENTEKGRANRTALSNLGRSLNNAYKAYVDVNGETSRANGIAATNYNRFVKAAEGAGYSASKARELARSIGLIKPKDVKIFANTHDAQGRIDALKGKIASVKGKTVEVHVSVTGTERLNAAGHRIGGYAHGGVVGHAAEGGPRNGLTWVGENGPELADMPPGTRVHSAGDSARMAGGGGQGMGGPIVVQLAVDGRIIAAALADPIRRFVHDRFGGVVQNAYGA